VAILIDHQNINIASGTQEFKVPTDIADTTTSFTIRLARCTSVNKNFWPNASTAVNAQLFLSNDGGLTYPRGAGAFTAVGGIITGPTGGELTESVAGPGTIPAPVGPGWQIKGVITVTNGPLRSQITVEVS